MTTTFEQVFRHLLNDIQLCTGLMLTEAQITSLVNKYVMEKDTVIDSSDDDATDDEPEQQTEQCECGDCEHLVDNKSYC